MNENKLAWVVTIGCLGLISGAIAIAAAFSPAAPDARAADASATTSAYARMFQERNRLQARVNYCERQKAGDTPAYRRACDEAELAKLDEYRKRVAEIDARLVELRESSAP
ncbi:MAG: hypothetical protein RIF32_01425 [Leptospirales bacterium]|jgi:hypothetical protein